MSTGPSQTTLSLLDGRFRARLREASYRQAGALYSIRVIVRRGVGTWSRWRIGPWRFRNFGARTIVGRRLRVAGSDRISIGDDVYIGRDSHLAVSVRRHESRPGSFLTIGSGTVLGDRLFVSCAGAIHIGRDVLGSHDIFITDTYHDYRDPRRAIIKQGLVEPAPVNVEDGAFLGRGCAILHGVTVGAGAYVAAGAVVVDDVPSRSVAVGNPAHVVSRWNEGSGRWVQS